MLKKFLREAVAIIVGKQSEGIADLLNTKKHMNEFLIAKKLDLTVNQTRNLLYKILNYGLVSFIRKKDKKKGWYTYFWKIEVLKSLEFLRSTLVKRTDQINYQIKSRETKEFYICKRCNIEFNEENALSYNFTCNECEDVFTIKDNTKLLVELKKNLGRLVKESGIIDEEIKKEKEKLEKEKIRVLKEEEKEKAKKKAAAVAKRKVARKLKISSATKSKTAPTRRHRGKDLVGARKLIKKVIPKSRKKVKKKKSVKKKKAKKKLVKKKPVKKKKAKKKISSKSKISSATTQKSKKISGASTFARLKQSKTAPTRRRGRRISPVKKKIKRRK